MLRPVGQNDHNFLPPNNMKSVNFASILIVALVLSLGSVGCKKGVKNPTPIPGSTAAPAPGPGAGSFPPVQNNNRLPIPDTTGANSVPIGTNPDGTIPGIDKIDELIDGRVADREAFKNETVYFDLDRSVVKSSEVSKVETVAAHLKSNPAEAVQIEGHCDDRGPENYNLALGERRAQSVRELLVSLGVDANRILTISYGEAKPAVEGADEAAWSKNRRGEFILLKAKSVQ